MDINKLNFNFLNINFVFLNLLNVIYLQELICFKILKISLMI